MRDDRAMVAVLSFFHESGTRLDFITVLEGSSDTRQQPAACLVPPDGLVEINAVRAG